MTRLDFATYLQHIRAESRRFREVLTDCDPSARVPGCPDWDAADLVWHLGEVQWFWARTIRTRPAAADEETPGPERPDTYAGLLAFFDASSTQSRRPPRSPRSTPRSRPTASQSSSASCTAVPRPGAGSTRSPTTYGST